VPQARGATRSPRCKWWRNEDAPRESLPNGRQEVNGHSRFHYVSKRARGKAGPDEIWVRVKSQEKLASRYSRTPSIYSQPQLH